MIAGGNRLSPTESRDETGGLRSNSDEVKKGIWLLRNLHFTNASIRASPHGEAFDKHELDEVI